MNFDEFAKLCHHDVEKYRDKFFVMLDLNGTIYSETIGFHFDVDEPEYQIEFIEMFKLFAPTALWCGNKHSLDIVNKLGYQATIFSFFEGGCFMVVLKTPTTLAK